MLQATFGDFIVSMKEEVPDHYDKHAILVEEFGLEHMDSSAFYFEVQRGDWPMLCVAQRYSPNHWAGSYPGVLLLPDTGILFVGAGERLLAYDLKHPKRLWEDMREAGFGFHRWRRHGDVVVMSAELGLAAWDTQGVKLWSAPEDGVFIEPPWEYRVESGIVTLDVMGAIYTFPLQTGPSGSRRR
jgi:hypothetical protein